MVKQRAKQQQFEDLESIVDHLVELGSSDGNLHVDDVLETTGQRSFGPLLVIPSLIAIMPVIGAIPGATILTGFLIILIAIEIVAGRKHIWAPERLRNIPIDRTAMRKGAKAMRPWAKRIDSFMSHRLSWVTQGVGFRLTAILLVLLGIVMIPTAVIPWGVLAPGSAAFIIALGLTARDGLVVLLGWFVSLAAFFGVYIMLMESGLSLSALGL